jgi:hypothetical protein
VFTVSTIRCAPGAWRATKPGNPRSARVAIPRPCSLRVHEEPAQQHVGGRRGQAARAGPTVQDAEADRLAVGDDRDRLALRVGLGVGQRLGGSAGEPLLLRARPEREHPIAQIRADRVQRDVHRRRG